MAGSGEGLSAKLVALLRPLCVDTMAGAALQCLIEKPPRQATINVVDSGIGRLYLDRAGHRPLLPIHAFDIEGIVGEGQELEFKPALRELLVDGAAQNKNMPNRYRTLETEDPDEALVEFYNKPEKHFLLIGPCARHQAILGHLQSLMPAATYVLLPGVQNPDTCAELHGAPIVEPRLEQQTYRRLIGELTEFDNLEGIA